LKKIETALIFACAIVAQKNHQQLHKNAILCNCWPFFEQTIATCYQKSENKPQKTITAGYQSENKPQQTITTVSKREHSYKKQATPI
jgi:hypothetical protein